MTQKIAAYCSFVPALVIALATLGKLLYPMAFYTWCLDALMILEVDYARWAIQPERVLTWLRNGLVFTEVLVLTLAFVDKKVFGLASTTFFLMASGVLFVTMQLGVDGRTACFDGDVVFASSISMVVLAVLCVGASVVHPSIWDREASG